MINSTLSRIIADLVVDRDLRISRMRLRGLLFVLNLFCSVFLTNGVKQLELIPGLKCSYNYDFEVHAHRGERTTKELNFKINAKVCLFRKLTLPVSVMQSNAHKTIGSFTT